MNKAFTLVELAIVIVIIGLLVGGVLQGQELIEASKRNAQIKQFSEYRAAVMTFYAKYNSMPGDTNKATLFFPSTIAVNGNADGKLSNAAGLTGYGVGMYSGEIEQFWIHLTLGKIVKETFLGGTKLGEGYPKMILYPNTGMIISSYDRVANIITSNAYLVMTIGNPAGMPDLDLADNIIFFKSGDAGLIDEKFDDGKPTTGLFAAVAEVGGLCHDGTNYNYSDAAKVCRPHYLLSPL